MFHFAWFGLGWFLSLPSSQCVERKCQVLGRIPVVRDQYMTALRKCPPPAAHRGRAPPPGVGRHSQCWDWEYLEWRTVLVGPSGHKGNIKKSPGKAGSSLQIIGFTDGQNRWFPLWSYLLDDWQAPLLECNTLSSLSFRHSFLFC